MTRRFFWLCLFLALLLVARIVWYWLMQVEYHLSGVSAKVASELLDEPRIESGQQVFSIGDYLVYVPLFPQWHFGDQVEITGTASCPAKAPSCLSPRIYKAEIRLVGRAETNPWVTSALTIRSKVILIYQTILRYDQANLLTGIVIGNVGVDRELRDKLAIVGLTHVVAASGMNVTIFSGLVMIVLGLLRWHRWLISSSAMVFVLFYCTITGFEPSIVRAAIMAGLTIAASVTGRQTGGWWGLVVAGYVMLWATPTLVVDPSFLLSFTAMAGQIYLSSIISGLPKVTGVWPSVFGYVKGIFAQSLSAIVFTFPIVMVIFARFSPISLFTNVAVLWTVEPLMVLGGLAGIVGMVSMETARWVMLPAGPMLGYFLWVVDGFGKNNSLVLSLPGLDWTFVLGYYLALAGVLSWWQGRSANWAVLKIRGQR